MLINKIDPSMLQWKSFLSRQFNQIREDGWAAVWLKAKALLKLAVIPFAIPVVLVIRLLRPLIIIRFGQLRSDRIGHFVGNTEMYLCERDVGIYDPRTFDVFYCSSHICNHKLKEMWGRHLHIFSPAIVLKWLSLANEKLPGAEKHTITLPSDRDTKGYLTRFEPHLAFTVEEESIGKQYLKSIGMNDEDKFICFITRDPAYLDVVHSQRSREEWSYHDYRDSCIHDHVPAVEAVCNSMGYYAFRMGQIVKDVIHSDNPKIIDYATNGDRSDFLDIYLAAKCHLFINSGSGFYAVPRIFRRPMVVVNHIPVGYPGGAFTCFIPKKLWWKKKRKWVTFREILTPPGKQFLHDEMYERSGIEWIDNTPEEITAVVIEAVQRLEGTWETTKEDEELQQRCLSIFSHRYMVAARTSTMGTEFLRQNQELLD